MMDLSGINLPQITDGQLDDKKERKQIRDALYQLTEQLRYTLNNLGEENFTADFLNSLQGDNGELAELKLTLEGLYGKVRDAEGNIAQLTLTSQQFSTELTSAKGDIASLLLTTNGLQVAINSSKLTFDANGLTIKNGGFRIVNASGTVVCYADTNGNLTMKGNGTFDTAKFCNEYLTVTYSTNYGCYLNATQRMSIMCAGSLQLTGDGVTIVPQYSGGNYIAVNARRENGMNITSVIGDRVSLTGNIVVNGRDITAALANL